MKIEGWWVAKTEKENLTPGKKYLIYKNKWGYIELINDKDKRVILNNEKDMNWNQFFEMFQSIENWRDSQLKKIGI